MNNVHFAIPEIYGETLSYYELLRKLVDKTNDLIDNYNTVPEQIAEAVSNLDASQLFSEVLNQLIHSIATDNTKSANAVKVYKKHDLLYATFNETVNLYESLIDFSTGTATELIVGTNIREVNISELFIELRKLIDINKNNIEAVTAVANENSAAIRTIHYDITSIENKNTEQDNEISTLRTMISTPYNFKGDVASISALPASGEINDTYYVQDVKYKVTWTGSAWAQSSLSEADYQTELSELKSDLGELNEKAYGIVTADYKTFSNTNINEFYEVVKSTIGAKTYCLPLETGKTYTIKSSGTEIKRGFSNELYSGNTFSLSYTSTVNYSSFDYTVGQSHNKYMYLSSGVNDISIYTSNGEGDIEKLDTRLHSLEDTIVSKLIESSVERVKNFIGEGEKTFSDGSNVISGNDNLKFLARSRNILIDLTDIAHNSDNVISDYNTKNNTIHYVDSDEKMRVRLDVEFTTVPTQFAIGFKKPEEVTSERVLINATNADFTNGKATFDFDVNDIIAERLGDMFIYVIGGGDSYRFSITGNVYTYKINTTKLSVNGYELYVGGDKHEQFNNKDLCKTRGKLVKNGTKIVDNNGKQIELRGVGLHHLLQYKNLHTRKTFESLKNYGVNLIRISVYLSDFAFSASDGEIAYGYISHPEETKLEIEKIVKICIDLGLYVLLDWHVMDDMNQVVSEKVYGLDRLFRPQAEEFFRYYSEKYANIPNVLYELANEPYSLTATEMLPYMQSIRGIIKSNVENPVLVMGIGLTEDNTKTSTYDRCKQMITVLSNNGITDIFASPHVYGNDVANYEKCVAENIPIFVSEWGNSTYTGDGKLDSNLHAIGQIDYLHQTGIPQAIWKFTDQTMTSSILKNNGIINSEKYMFGFSNDDLSETGALALNSFRRYAFFDYIER